MKKIITDFVCSLGARTAYDGHTRTMWIKGAPQIKREVEKKFGKNLPFNLVVNNY